MFPAKIALAGTSLVTVLPASTMAFSPTTRWREWSLPSRWKPPFDEGALHTPVLLGRERTIGSCGVGPAVVDQGDTVSDEDVVFHGYAFAGEGAAGDLAAISELHIFSNLYECVDFRSIANFTTIKAW